MLSLLGWLGNLTFLFFIVFTFYYIFKYFWKEVNGIFSAIGALIMTILSELAAAIVFMIFSMVISCIHTPKYTENIEDNKVQIYSIGLNNSVEGRFVLGTGNVDGKSTYRYFAKVTGGGYKCFEVDAKKTTIIETDECTPYIQFYKGKRCTCDGNWLMTAYFGNNEPMWRDTFSEMDKSQVIYLPKGSIVQTYEIRP